MGSLFPCERPKNTQKALSKLIYQRGGEHPDVVGDDAPQHLALKMFKSFPIAPFDVKAPYQIGNVGLYTAPPLL